MHAKYLEALCWVASNEYSHHVFMENNDKAFLMSAHNKCLWRTNKQLSQNNVKALLMSTHNKNLCIY